MKCCFNTEDIKTLLPREPSAVVFVGLLLAVKERHKAKLSVKALDFLALAGAENVLSLEIGLVAR